MYSVLCKNLSRYCNFLHDAAHNTVHSNTSQQTSSQRHSCKRPVSNAGRTTFWASQSQSRDNVMSCRCFACKNWKYVRYQSEIENPWSAISDIPPRNCPSHKIILVVIEAPAWHSRVHESFVIMKLSSSSWNRPPRHKSSLFLLTIEKPGKGQSRHVSLYLAQKTLRYRGSASCYVCSACKPEVMF